MERIDCTSKTELKSYSVTRGSSVVAHKSLMNKKWWLGFCFAVLGFLLLLYLPVYHELQTRIGETWDETVVGIEGWSYNTSRDMKQYVLPDNTTALQQPTNICQQSLYLLVIVCTAVDNFKRREGIRKSWASDTLVDNKTIKYLYLVGQTENQTVQEMLLSEFEEYNDIIQERFIDSYNNLTLKSVMLLKWVNNHCGSKVKFVMKSDDDTYVNVPRLMKLLKDYNNKSQILVGALICDARPVANVNNKWYAPKFMYPGRVYPNYLSGSAYLMSSNVVTKLYKVALLTRIFHIEDVFITGICAQRARIKPINNDKFSFTRKKLDPCEFNNFATIHRVTEKQMEMMYHRLQQTTYEECSLQLFNETLNATTNKEKRRRRVITKKNGCY